MIPNIILASRSQVRKEVLDGLGLVYSICPSTFEEKIENTGNFGDLTQRLALGKTKNVASNVKTPSLVIGADSFAVFDNEIIGKPHTKHNAIAQLTRLSGRKHDFYTGMAIVDTYRRQEMVDIVAATVFLKKLSLTEIKQYVEKEEVLTAAGAYRIQGLGATLVKKIIGDYYAIVGISPTKLAEMFKRLGYSLYDFIPRKRKPRV